MAPKGARAGRGVPCLASIDAPQVPSNCHELGKLPFRHAKPAAIRGFHLLNRRIVRYRYA